MGGKNAPGFTIIETMLFLAVSGVLAIGIITSAGYALNVQRYRDSAMSFISYLQSQYDRVINVQNNRSSDLTCTAEAGIQQSSNAGTLPGTTNCTIIGVYLKTIPDNSGFSSEPVYAANDRRGAKTDIEALKNAGLFTNDPANVSPEQYRFEWGATISEGKARLGGQDINTPFNVLIVRSPSSGAIRTFVGRSANDTPKTIVESAGTEGDLTICLDPPSTSYLNENITGATIYSGAANASAVKQVEDNICKK